MQSQNLDSLSTGTCSETPESRTASPARPKALGSSLQPKTYNVTPSGKMKADVAMLKANRKKSPLPLRKTSVPPPSGADTSLQGSSTGLSVGGIHHRPRAVSHAGSSSQEDQSQPTAEDAEVEGILAGSAVATDSSSDLIMVASGDEADYGTSTPDIQRTKAAIEQIHLKVIRTKEMIKAEQTARDDNVDEYLRLASNADRAQLHRIKTMFEKRNQRSAQTIALLQKKLENYSKKKRELELYGLAAHRQPKEVLRNVGQGILGVGSNIRDGISGFGGTVMSKPREFAHLIKNKFGSADNINNMTKPLDEGGNDESERAHHGSATFTQSTGTKYTSDDESSSITSGSGPLVGIGVMSSPRNQSILAPQTTGSLSHCISHSVQAITHTMAQTIPSLPSITSTSAITPTHNLEQLLLELQERKDENQRFQEDYDSLKTQMQQEISYFHQALQEERYRYERLEEQMNDLIELHQNEIENLKQGISDMEEKVQYQSEERLRDMHEMLESCQTKISRMEHQQQQHQQLVTLEGIENSNARALVLKLINIVLTVLQVVLLLVATASSIIMPFMKTRVRIMTTSVIVVVLVLMFRQWPEMVDFMQDLVLGPRKS